MAPMKDKMFSHGSIVAPAAGRGSESWEALAVVRQVAMEAAFQQSVR